jgi:L-cysteine S-thiosulfotransferase
MRHNARSMIKTVFISTALTSIAVTGYLSSSYAAEKEMTVVEKGKELAFDRSKGNCLACHVMDDGTLPGNIAPPLVAMSLRYPDKEKLRAQIWDATVANPNTIMPPFGRHQILTEEEIDEVVEYVYTL